MPKNTEHKTCELVVTRVFRPLEPDKEWALYEGYDSKTGRTLVAVGPRSIDGFFIPDIGHTAFPRLKYRFRKSGNDFKAYIVK